MMSYDLLFILLILICIFSRGGANPYASYANGGARDRFESKFNQTCSKYSFVQKYIDMMDNPRREYLIFVFHEAGVKNGGLGDRLAGMVTALAYALRTGRTFLAQGDSAFEASFRPYHPSYNPKFHLSYDMRPSSSGGSSADRGKYSWKSWDWAGWNVEYSANMSKLSCVNPRPGEKHCALDDSGMFKAYKVIKYYGNRSYLCRWSVKPSLHLQEELAHILDIQVGVTDLYEVAGCLLRLAIWPTENLWSALDDSMQHQLARYAEVETDTNRSLVDSTAASSSFSGSSYSSSDNNSTTSSNSNDDCSPTMVVKTHKQVGFHFRCGDSSFSTGSTSSSHHHHQHKAPNPECYYDPAVPWKGTSFADDRSIDSPVDEATCGRKILFDTSSTDSSSDRSNAGANSVSIDSVGSSTGTTTTTTATTTTTTATTTTARRTTDEDDTAGVNSARASKYVMAYIASDNGMSSRQINETLQWGYTVKPPQPCHVDLQKSAHCSLSTSLHWFMLSLSDIIVMQALIKPSYGPFFNSPETAGTWGEYPEPAPVSAFSRFAAIYALTGAEGGLRYGKECKIANTTALSYETHGNWACDPKVFF